MIEDRIEQLVENWSEGMVVPVEASRLVKKLRRSQPDLLASWLDQHAERIVSVQLQQALAHTRHRIRREAGPRAFQKWRKEIEAGHPMDAAVFEAPYCVDTTGTWKRLADMTREDCLFVADDRRERVKEQLLEEQFMRALAKRLEDGQTVAERFDVRELERLNGALAA